MCVGDNGRLGRHPFIEHDPARLSEPFWENVDQIVDMANDLGLGLSPLAQASIKAARKFESLVKPWACEPRTDLIVGCARTQPT